METLIQSTAYVKTFFMVDAADHISPKTGLTVTVTLSKNGGAFAAAGGTVAEIANGWYKITLNTTDTNTLGDLAFHCTGTNADDTDFACKVETANLSSILAAIPTAVQIRTEMDNNSVDLDNLVTAANNIQTAINALPAVMVATLFAAGTETGLTFLQLLRLIIAAEAGLLSGAGTNSIVIKSFDGTKNRIVASVDSTGNRLSIVYDLT